MKNLIKSTLVFIGILIYCTPNSLAQNSSSNVKSDIEGGTLSSQFDYVIEKSETFQAYKVVKIASLNKLKTNSLDSIKLLKENIISLESNVQEQQKEINALKSELQETNENLNQITAEKDSFSFLGILMSKGSYNLFVWSLVFIMLFALLVMIFLFNRSNSITVKTKKSLIEKQDEFDAHRKWALEREQTLARDLNKLKQKYKGLD